MSMLSKEMLNEQDDLLVEYKMVLNNDIIKLNITRKIKSRKEKLSMDINFEIFNEPIEFLEYTPCFTKCDYVLYKNSINDLFKSFEKDGYLLTIKNKKDNSFILNISWDYSNPSSKQILDLLEGSNEAYETYKSI